MAASIGLERRYRSNSYSQGDSSSYSFQLRSSVKKELKETRKQSFKDTFLGKDGSSGSPLYGTKSNTILEDYEVDVAILLSQMNKHNIELVHDDEGHASSSSEVRNAMYNVCYHISCSLYA
jgi:hypothetical protein